MRLFIAFDCKQLSGSLRSIQEKLPYKGFRLVSWFHITLKFLGEVDDMKIPRIISILSEVRMDKITVSLSEVGCFPSPKAPRIVWVSVWPQDRLHDLKKDIDDSLLQDFDADTGFTPHITLARISPGKRPAHFHKLISSLKAPPDKAIFDQFKLMKSTLTGIGPVYEEVARFP